MSDNRVFHVLFLCTGNSARSIIAECLLNHLRQAADRIKPYVHHTPVLTCASLDHMANAHLFFKCENFQKVGAFKFRGACNTVFSLSETEAKRGVATHSSGNHGAALAHAAQLRNIPAHIVMPHNVPQVKRDAIAGYGARITWCEPSQAAREATVKRVMDETGAVFAHPSNDALVIAGQGTAAMELLDDVPKLNMVLAPIGGGGLTSGLALAIAARSPRTRMVAVEPVGADGSVLR